MSIDSEGRILITHTDLCVNYDPDKTQPTSVESAQSGRVYVCKNLKLQQDETAQKIGGCFYCENRQDKPKQ